jgi:hypothetical protein
MKARNPLAHANPSKAPTRTSDVAPGPPVPEPAARLGMEYLNPP